MRNGFIYALVGVVSLLLAVAIFKVVLGLATVLFYVVIPLALLLLIVWLLVRVL